MLEAGFWKGFTNSLAEKMPTPTATELGEGLGVLVVALGVMAVIAGIFFLVMMVPRWIASRWKNSRRTYDGKG